MKGSPHLLLRSPLLPDESLPSYLARLAKLNGYHTPNMVAQICRERLSQPDIVTRPTQAETYIRLAELVQLDDNQLYTASAHSLALTLLPAGTAPTHISLPSAAEVVVLPSGLLRQHLWPETDIQFCPHCLAETPYHRLAWLPQAVSVCLAHRCLLVRGCPVCGHKLKIGDAVEGRCGHCAFDLQTSPTISVVGDHFGLFSQRAIQVWLKLRTTNRVDHERLPRQPSYILYQVAYGLHRAIRTIRQRWDYLHDPFGIEPGHSIFPCEKKSELTPFKSYVVYATALKALQRWPHGLFEFLNAFTLRNQAEPTQTVANDLGSIYTTWLMNAWKQPELSFLRMAFEQYFQKHFAFSMALQQKYRSAGGPTDEISAHYMTYHDAAQRLNISVAIVERSVELRLLKSHAKSQRKPHQFKLVSRDSVSALKRWWRYGIPLSDAASLLGVSQGITRDMVKAGLIKAISNPKTNGYKRWKIGNQSLAYFFKRLERSGVRYLYDQPVKIISLTEAAQAIKKDERDTVFLIEQILAGALRAYWPPAHRNLKQLRVSVEDLETLQQPIHGNQSRSFRLVSEKLEVQVTAVSTEMNGKSPEVRPTASQLAQQLGISQDYL